MTYYELLPNYFYQDESTNNVPNAMVKFWRNSEGIRKRDLSLQLSDLKAGTNLAGNYRYAVKGNDNGACATARQFFGSILGSGWISIGNKSIIAGACWDTLRGSAQELGAFIHKIMTEPRYDEGKINDAKTAGTYKTP